MELSVVCNNYANANSTIKLVLFLVKCVCKWRCYYKNMSEWMIECCVLEAISVMSWWGCNWAINFKQENNCLLTKMIVLFGRKEEYNKKFLSK